MHALETFEVAARHRSFLKAADELCVSQSVVSHRSKQLEDDFGVKLFLRVNRNIVLTPAGEGSTWRTFARRSPASSRPPAPSRKVPDTASG